MTKEGLPAFEEQDKKSEQKRGWGRLRTFMLAGSLLVNGGFLAEKAQQREQLDNIQEGRQQSFVIDRPFATNNVYDKETASAGEKGEFSLVQNEDKTWTLTGNISSYYASSREPAQVRNVPLHTVTYKLPPLPPEAASAIFADVKRLSKRGGPGGQVLGFLDQLIESAREGKIVEYSAAGQPIHEIEITDPHGKGLSATETLSDGTKRQVPLGNIDKE
jgi:hypothetical protein